MMEQRGFHNIVVYLDDFNLSAATYEECLTAMNMLLRLLRTLSFHINWSKVEGPAQVLTFLGIKINSLDIIIAIPEE